MINRLKQSVKSLLEERKTAEYYAYLDELYVSYHDWITRKEEIYREAIKEKENGLKAEIIALENYVEEKQNPGKMPDADILIFATDDAYLDTYVKEVVCAYFAENPDCLLVYGDEDEWNANRTIRMNPWFKPDFSPDTLLQYFYYGNVIALRRHVCTREKLEQWKRCQNIESRLKWLYECSLDLSFPVDGEKIGHVPYVLYHTPNLVRLCTGREYDDCRNPYIEMVQDKNLENAKVSIIIPSKDHPDILGLCLDSIVQTAGDTDYEILVVDNGSNKENRAKYDKMKVKYGFNYIFQPMEFHFSKMCNLGAEHAAGEILLFLNDDIEAIETGWLTQMKKYTARSYIGAVGAKLYYPGAKMIQHAGITNLRLGPVHKLQFLEDVRPYYDGRNWMDHNVLAVTGACLMARKEVFESCGGFSEELAVAFNDVELCFRIYKKGYYNVVCNSIALYHHESLSRGSDEAQEKQIRLQNERNKMYAMHPDVYGRDPFYHSYLNNLILDTRYSCAYEYPAGADVAVEEPVSLKEGIKEEWYNECLQISLEYAGDLDAWTQMPDQKGNYVYFQGYQFVIGSENPCFDRYLLCKNEKTGEVWTIPCIPTFRPDLDWNVKEGHASLCGFSLVIHKENLPKGRYLIGGMAKSSINRQVLCRFTNKYIEV